MCHVAHSPTIFQPSLILPKNENVAKLKISLVPIKNLLEVIK